MSATRTKAAASAPTRTTRSRRTVTTTTSATAAAPTPKTDAADVLASELDRVLKVGQPKAKGAAPVSRQMSSKVSSRAPESKTTGAPPARRRVADPIAATTSRTALRPAATAPARTTASATTSTAAKGKAKASTTTQPAPETKKPVPVYPWSTPGQLSSRERALAAQTVVKDASRVLAEAQRAAFKHGGISDKTETALQVEAAVRDNVAGLTVLRELFCGEAAVQSQMLNIQRSALNLALQCLIIDMYQHALSVLQDMRPWILRLYDHDDPVVLEEAPTSSRLMKGPARVDYNRLSSFPSPNGELDESVRALICNFTFASWVSLLALGKVTLETIESCLPFPRSPSDLNPVNLAPTLPAGGNASTLAILAYRQLSTMTVTPSSPQYLHVRRLASFFLIFCVNKAQVKSSVPSHVWESVSRTAHLYLKDRTDDDGAKREIAVYIETIVEVVDRLCASRNEPSAQWFIKPWPEVADMWIGIGRTLGDSVIIDKALATMTIGVTIAGAGTRSGTPESESAPESQEAFSTSVASVEATTRLTRISAQFARILLDVDALSSLEKPTSAKLETLLESADVHAIVQPLCNLENSESSVPTASSALRGVERLRRIVIKLVDRPVLSAVARAWLQSAFATVEAVLNGVRAPSLLQPVARDTLAGVVDTTTNLLRACDVNASAASAIETIDRAYALWQTVGERLEPPSRLQYGAFLIQAAHSTAWRMTRANVPEGAELAGRACDWSVALRSVATADEAVAKAQAWEVTEAALPKRFELLGFAAQNDKAKAFEAYVLGLVNLPQAAVDSIERLAKSQSLKSAFDEIPDAVMLLKRIAVVLTADDAIDADVTAILKSAFASRQLPEGVRAALAEQIVEAIEHAQFRLHVQQTIVAFCDLALQTYDVSHPIRRMRVIVRLLSLIVSSGAVPERFPQLVDEVASLASMELGKDTNLAQYKFEYQSSALMLSALNKYHTETEPSEAVAALGGQAVEMIRAVVLPPIKETSFPAATGRRAAAGGATQRRPAVKTATRPPVTRSTKPAVAKSAVVGRRPAVKSEAKPNDAAPVALVTDDIDRFAQLLGSLASLFGLLGHVFPRLESLKVLRAVLRTSDRMSDALVHTSGLLAVEYSRLGKFTRATQVFSQALKHVAEAKGPVSAGTRVDLCLRHARFLASTGQAQQAREEYSDAEALMGEIAVTGGNITARYVELCATSERIALANGALAAIKMAEMDVTAAIEGLTVAYRLWCRAASGISRVASAAVLTEQAPAEATTTANPPSQPPTPAEVPTSADPSKATKPKQPFSLSGKHLGGMQWYYALGVFDATLDLVAALAQRGTVKECEYYISQAANMVPSVRSTALDARVCAQTAALDARKAKYESSAASLRHAAQVLAVTDGPDAIELKRLRGELYSRQQAAPEADEFFTTAIEAIVSLDEEFAISEAHTGSPRKEIKTHGNEPLLPRALGHILRQRAWLLREAGEVDEYQNVIQQLQLVPDAAGEKPDQLFLAARVAMSEAFNHFKTDLFMSSLTESTIAMTMASADKRVKDRQSTRHAANILLEQAVEAFRTALAADSRIGRVEDVRQACVSLAVLGAFQTSLGQGSSAITSMAAGILASICGLTLDRELVPAINSKFPVVSADDLAWPALEPMAVSEDEEGATCAYWREVATRRAACDILEAQYDLSCLPHSWAVVSITVTDDRNTMLVTRHQNGFDPVVFCIPLDRQGRRDGEDESGLFTFDAGINELKSIMEGNDESIKSIKSCQSIDDRRAWWKERYALDTRLGELLASIEFCWLGAFKTVLNPRPIINSDAFAAFRGRLDLIFQNALSSAGSDLRRGARVRLNDTLLTCFATLSSKCKDEEVEDLVYFVLDQYQFHGIAVALAELDFEQLGVDVKAALADLEASTAGTRSMESKEHLLLALDKNVQGIPWESLPILRGRAVSRIPSLPFLLDQAALAKHLDVPVGKRTVDASKTTFFMNPGGDLVGTQGRFAERLDALEKKGWVGLRGRAPSESEIEGALRDSELVMYYGHGGGEEYIRAYKIRALPRCAVVMLWGCSSGLLRDHGDLDRTGTPYDYVLAGSPCLVANLWDVTDKDIDRVTMEVMDNLGLNAEHLSEPQKSPMSVVQAVSAARTTAKLEYLTGAATVVYGIPVYIQ